MSGANLQIRADGRLRHFLSIEGLDRRIFTEILDTASGEVRFRF